jgi:hypothetical protein
MGVWPLFFGALVPSGAIIGYYLAVHSGLS